MRTPSPKKAKTKRLPPSWVELQEQVKALKVEDFPAAPFKLNPVTRIHDTEAWLKNLWIEVSQGPEGPKSYMGTLWVDLRDAARVLREEKARRAQSV